MRLTNHLRLLTAIVLVLSLGGCASYIGNRIIAAPNQGSGGLQFDGEAGEFWNEHVEQHFFSERIVLESPHDRSVLVSHRLPAGDYPHRYEFEMLSPRQFRLEFGIHWGGGPHQPALGTVIYVHGWQGDYRQHFFHALALADDGWNGVLTDLRGHGQSGGDQISFGVHEAIELKALIDEVVSDPDFTPPLILMGSSMGAAVALLAASEDDRVDGVVAIAPYADFMAVFPDGLQRMAPRATRRFLNPKRVERALVHARERSQADLAEAAPILRATTISAPVLLIHGETDRFVPSEQSQQLAEALPSAELILLEDLGHMALIMDRDSVLEATRPWLAKYFGHNED